MANQIRMPQLSDTMDSGKILGWKKKVGDSVSRGEIIAEVETDKANLEIESFQQGTLLQISVAAGEKARVGDVIAVIGNPGEEVAVQTSTAAPQPIPQTSQTQTATPAPISAPSFSSDRVKASPLAKKIAEQQHIDISQMHGTGPGGRIIKKDLEQPAPHQPPSSTTPLPASAHIPAPTPPPSTQPSPTASSITGSLQPLSKMRETIARRMQESVSQSPHFFVTTSINMREALRLKEALKEREDLHGLSLNHLIIKAAAYALVHENRANYAFRDGQIYQPGQMNIGIVTAIDDGLLIPVIKDADQLSLGDLVFEAKAAIERARAGRPNSTDLSGGTFSISNMGMMDIDNFTAIINPGQGAILAVSSVRTEAVVENNQVVPGQRMKVTLSSDHRVIDGVVAANFLKHFKQALEMPAVMLV